jgi:hypothetical protein
MSLLAWASVVTSVRKQVFWTEANKIEFAHVLVIEVISVLQTDVERVVTICAH